ncbi:ABC transporter permease [Gracilibacillus alcaliphilus]|uniref:ABC transporter permease n=1 Tax=Gracilibacillus alcaliphilus TaxID=1401441 RepID=UPI00195D6FF0|nr:ABC transporter permease [Gracilibacillus alcaliphilus]MBM7677056.1 ABC-2 type transport system permease protein [Gracilibacillus alcaliphilus]
MKDIFLLQWQRLRRRPFMVLVMIAMTSMFVFFIGGANLGDDQLSIPVYFTDEVSETEQAELNEALKEMEGVSFYQEELEEMREAIVLGDVSFGLQLSNDHYTFVRSTENPYQSLVDNHLRSVYWEKLQMDRLTSEEEKAQVTAALENPPIVVDGQMGESEQAVFVYNNQLQALFGMTLFFAIYTIVFSLGEVAEEKQRGSWDRLILSPVRKWQVYLGHLLFAFFIGMLQISVVFLMFELFFDFTIGRNWPAVLLICACYTLAIVALGMLLTGLVKKSSQLSAVVPIISVSMAMLGGAYWPLEVVNSRVLLVIAEVIPVKHAMEALKGITMYGHGLTDLTQPLAVLLLMSVLCMGIGVNVMERR